MKTREWMLENPVLAFGLLHFFEGRTYIIDRANRLNTLPFALLWYNTNEFPFADACL